MADGTMTAARKRGEGATKEKMKVAAGIELRPIDLVTMNVRLIGDSPLIVSRFSEKAKRMILESHMKKAKKAQEAKDPQAISEDARYRMSGERDGFPVIAFKAAAVRACTSAGMAMTEARQAFMVTGEHSDLDGAFEGAVSSMELTEIFGPPPQIREDMVRISGKTADIRYRAQYWPWAVEVPVTFNAGFISAEQLLDIFKVAGFAVGIGEWRPERNGNNGRFRLATAADVWPVGGGSETKRRRPPKAARG